ncbi:hypothetical protein Tco_0445529 [Tanacetum coccineum]
MVAAGGNFIRKTPQEAYDLIENMTQHHFQWDAVVYYNTTTDMSVHYSKTTFASRERVEVLRKQTRYTIQSVQHNPRREIDSPFECGSPTPSSDPVFASLSPALTPTGDSDSILEETDDPLEAKNSKINSLIKGPSDTFLIRDKDIKLNPPMDVDNLVLIPRVSEKPLDSLNLILETSKTTITDPLFDFNSEFTLNSDNPILDIQNKESDESETETIMDEVQINST